MFILHGCSVILRCCIHFFHSFHNFTTHNTGVKKKFFFWCVTLTPLLRYRLMISIVGGPCNLEHLSPIHFFHSFHNFTKHNTGVVQKRKTIFLFFCFFCCFFFFLFFLFFFFVCHSPLFRQIDDFHCWRSLQPRASFNYPFLAFLS